MKILLIWQDALLPKGRSAADQLLTHRYLGGRIIAIDAVIGLLEHHMRVLQEVLANNEQL